MTSLFLLSEACCELMCSSMRLCGLPLVVETTRDHARPRETVGAMQNLSLKISVFLVIPG